MPPRYRTGWLIRGASPPLRPETPGQQRRNIGSKEGVGISFNLGNSARNVLLNVAPPGGPDDPNQEPIEGRGRAVRPVILGELHICGEKLVGAGYVPGGGSMRHRLCTHPTR